MEPGGRGNGGGSNPGSFPDHYERQAAVRRKITYHVREIQAPGLDVPLTRPSEPEPYGPGGTQAA